MPKKQSHCTLCGSYFHSVSACPWQRLERSADPEVNSKMAVSYMLYLAMRPRFVENNQPTPNAKAEGWNTVEEVDRELFLKAVDRVVGKVPQPEIKTQDVPFTFEDPVTEFKEKLEYDKG